LNNSKYILFLLLLVNSFVFAQKTEANFTKEIKLLNSLTQDILDAESDSIRHTANSTYKGVLKEIIGNKKSFDYKFDELIKISILKENDLKIYNWVLPLTDGTYEYFAFLQIRKSKEEFRIVELTDKSESIKTPENKILTAKNWYGALYYKIIHNKSLGKNYYTVLGWDGNNNLTNKKIIDVINVSKNGMIKFGAPIFKTTKKTKKRVIFEYSESSVMSLKHHDNMNKIVFDYLVPASSKLKGIYEYYGPSLNRFDAFYLEKKKWIYEVDIEIELDRNIKDNFWKDPKEK